MQDFKFKDIQGFMWIFKAILAHKVGNVNIY